MPRRACSNGVEGIGRDAVVHDAMPGDPRNVDVAIRGLREGEGVGVVAACHRGRGQTVDQQVGCIDASDGFVEDDSDRVQCAGQPGDGCLGSDSRRHKIRRGGAEGTVEGAHVVNSTAQMSRSIADVYAVRRDWYDANKEWVKKFVAGQLKATEKLVAMRRGFSETKKLSKEYEQILSVSQKIFGKETIPTLEEDAHGLLLDCSFVGLNGQPAFFLDKGNLSGFTGKMGEALDLATLWGYAKGRYGFDPNNFTLEGDKSDYASIAKMAGIELTGLKARENFDKSKAESTDLFLGENLDTNTIVSFTIGFEPDQKDFSADRYGSDFARALREASKFGNARVVIRGHSDPTKTLLDLIKSGINKGVIQQNGTAGNYRYFMNGKPLDLNRTKEVVELIKGGAFGGGNPDPSVTMQAALNLSKSRADNVFAELQAYAKREGMNIDLSQIVPVGAGVVEPVIPKPKNIEEAKENMRVEFRIVKVNPESLAPSDFNF